MRLGSATHRNDSGIPTKGIGISIAAEARCTGYAMPQTGKQAGSGANVTLRYSQRTAAIGHSSHPVQERQFTGAGQPPDPRAAVALRNARQPWRSAPQHFASAANPHPRLDLSAGQAGAGTAMIASHRRGEIFAASCLYGRFEVARAIRPPAVSGRSRRYLCLVAKGGGGRTQVQRDAAWFC